MKYMCVWSATPENAQALAKRYKEGSEPMEGVKDLGRWFSIGTGVGFRLVETEDPIALKKVTRYWQDLMEVEIVPVLDDEENQRSFG